MGDPATAAAGSVSPLLKAMLLSLALGWGLPCCDHVRLFRGNNSVLLHYKRNGPLFPSVFQMNFFPGFQLICVFGHGYSALQERG